MLTVRRALLSVSDKHGLIPFATGLAELGVEILSTGGTCRALREAGLDVIEVSEKTGFPEIMDGRVKTLHPVIHGGLLGRRGTDEGVMSEHGIEPIDLLTVNLYPFEQTIARQDATIDDAIENIDIGGPAMIRAASKNHHGVAVVLQHHVYRVAARHCRAGLSQLPRSRHRQERRARVGRAERTGRLRRRWCDRTRVRRLPR